MFIYKMNMFAFEKKQSSNAHILIKWSLSRNTSICFICLNLSLILLSIVLHYFLKTIINQNEAI